jgi:hypothetical protein
MVRGVIALAPSWKITRPERYSMTCDAAERSDVSFISVPSRASTSNPSPPNARADAMFSMSASRVGRALGHADDADGA